MKETVVTLNLQAMELASKGDFSEAIACLKRALSLEKFNYLLWYNLGLTYRDAGEYKKSLHALEQAHQLNEDDDEVIEMLAIVCLNLGEMEEAHAYCSEGLQKNARNAHLWNTLGVIHFNCNEFEEACGAFEEAVTLNSYYYDALYNLRDTYEELGNQAGYQQCMLQMHNIQMNEDKGDK
ncbi:MAG: tetratricopeptide repeat protein [Treponema sp.]|nr:tetratricopeptide repeat protein [Candidatus Treponema equifaecale]